MASHKIKKQIIELRLDSEKGSFHLQTLTGRIYRDKVLPVIEKYFDLLSDPDTVYRLDYLELDLGKISLKKLEDEFPREVEKRLGPELKKLISEQQLRTAHEETDSRKDYESSKSGAVSADGTKSLQTERKFSESFFRAGKEAEKGKKGDDRELLYYFLKTGRLPWWSEKLESGELESVFQRLISENPSSIKALAESLPKNKRLFKRLVHQFSDRLLGKLAALFVISGSGFVARTAVEVSRVFQKADRSRTVAGHELRFQLWLAVFSALEKTDLKTEKWLRLFEMELRSALAEADAGLKKDISKALGKLAAEASRSDGDFGSESKDRRFRDGKVIADRQKAQDGHKGLLREFETAQTPPDSDDDFGSESKRRRSREDEIIAERAEVQDDHEDLAREKVFGLYLRKALDALLNKPDFSRVFQTVFVGGESFGEIKEKANRLFLLIDSFQTVAADEEPLKYDKIIKEARFFISRLEKLSLADIPGTYKRDVVFILNIWKKLSYDESRTVRDAKEAERYELDGDGSSAADASEILDRGISDFSRSDEIYVSNSGLVLFGPYLPRFFETLGLIENKAFISAFSAERGALLLQYLADGSIETGEDALPLNKILCGLDLEEPLPAKLDITLKEKREAEGLLQTLLRHWGIEKNISPDGLQRAFLRREGVLTIRDADWLLRIERKTHDILLDKLPWSIGVIKLPWLERIIFTEW